MKDGLIKPLWSKGNILPTSPTDNLENVVWDTTVSDSESEDLKSIIGRWSDEDKDNDDND